MGHSTNEAAAKIVAANREGIPSSALALIAHNRDNPVMPSPALVKAAEYVNRLRPVEPLQPNAAPGKRAMGKLPKRRTRRRK